MNCSEVRFEIGSDPGAPLSPAAAAHLAECPGCTQYRHEMQSLENDLRQALQRPFPLPAPARRGRRPSVRFVQARRWAIAASLLVVAGALLLWSVRPSTSLAAEVIAHVEGEPASWTKTALVLPAEVQAILRRAGVSFTGPQDVVYAQSCTFHGHFVPHLVVRTTRGPFTVIVLPGEHVSHPEHFRESGYSGVFIPGRGGTLAVLGLGDAAVDDVGPQVARTLSWSR